MKVCVSLLQSVLGNLNDALLHIQLVPTYHTKWALKQAVSGCLIFFYRFGSGAKQPRKKVLTRYLLDGKLC